MCRGILDIVRVSNLFVFMPSVWHLGPTLLLSALCSEIFLARKLTLLLLVVFGTWWKIVSTCQQQRHRATDNGQQSTDNRQRKTDNEQQWQRQQSAVSVSVDGLQNWPHLLQTELMKSVTSVKSIKSIMCSICYKMKTKLGTHVETSVKLHLLPLIVE